MKMIFNRAYVSPEAEVLEFALESGESLDVYFGSPAEIAATLLAYAEAHADSAPEGAVCLALEGSSTAVELADACAALGLPISERTAHRVLSGQIAPLDPVLETVAPARPARRVQEADIFRDSRTLKIAEEDIERFSRKLAQAFEDIAERYYVILSDEPRIKVGRDGIKVFFPIEKE